MPRSPRSHAKPIRLALPTDLLPAALVLEAVVRQGLVEQLDRDLALSRRGGHTGNSLFAFAVVFLMSGPGWGVRPFAERLRGALGRALSAIAGVKCMPSSAAVSRMLATLPSLRSRASIDRLLLSPPGMGDLLSNPHVLQRDANGGYWHVVDIDPTVVPFRQRALPEGDDLPDPVRRAPGEPGYVGQKRGEFRVRDIPVVHAGAGLWLGVRRVVEEGSVVSVAGELVGLAVAALKNTRAGGRVIARYDGEFGSVGAMRATLDAGAAVVTRLSRYALLDTPEAVAVLASAAWYPVPSSGSGPPREAAELGTYVLKPSARAAGSKEPVTARVVVTRISRAGAAEHGIVRDGYQYELFATTLTAEAWPCEDLVALYFGRSSIENRFAQEDREFDLSRTFSNQASGQEWMCGVGLFLWNFLVCKGVELNPLPARPARQAKRVVAVAGSADAPSPAPVTPPPASAPPPVEDASQARRNSPTATAEGALWALTCAVFADIKRRPDWTFDHRRRRLFCPNKMPFKYLNVSAPRGKRKNYQLTMYPGTAACDGCPLRATCIPTLRPGALKPSRMKMVSRCVYEETAKRAQALLDARDLEPKRELPDDGPLQPPPPPPILPPPPRKTGDRVVFTPLFLPAESRKQTRAALVQQRVEFLLYAAHIRKPRRHRLLARDDADRQHRRTTWSHRRSARSNPERVELRPPAGAKSSTIRTLLGVEPI